MPTYHLLPLPDTKEGTAIWRPELLSTIVCDMARTELPLLATEILFLSVVTENFVIASHRACTEHSIGSVAVWETAPAIT